MQQIEAVHFHTLIEHATAVAPDLVPACRWLACGPEMAPLILGEDTRQPSPAELARLLHELRTAPREAATAGHLLLAMRHRLLAKLDVALERLIAAGEDEWSHPAEILGRPRPDFGQLLDACRARLEARNGDRQRLETVREKLDRATRLETKARQRRAAGR